MQYIQVVTAGQGHTIKAFAHPWPWSHLSQSATPLKSLLEQWPLLGLLGTGEWLHLQWGNPWVHQLACGETIAPPRGLHEKFALILLFSSTDLLSCQIGCY